MIREHEVSAPARHDVLRRDTRSVSRVRRLSRQRGSFKRHQAIGDQARAARSDPPASAEDLETSNRYPDDNRRRMISGENYLATHNRESQAEHRFRDARRRTRMPERLEVHQSRQPSSLSASAACERVPQMLRCITDERFAAGPGDGGTPSRPGAAIISCKVRRTLTARSLRRNECRWRSHKPAQEQLDIRVVGAGLIPSRIDIAEHETSKMRRPNPRISDRWFGLHVSQAAPQPDRFRNGSHLALRRRNILVSISC